MSDMTSKSKEKVAGFICATAICMMALACDGVTALTLSLGVAAGIAGVAGYAAGSLKGEK